MTGRLHGTGHDEKHHAAPNEYKRSELQEEVLTYKSLPIPSCVFIILATIITIVIPKLTFWVATLPGGTAFYGLFTFLWLYFHVSLLIFLYRASQVWSKVRIGKIFTITRGFTCYNLQMSALAWRYYSGTHHPLGAIRREAGIAISWAAGNRHIDRLVTVTWLVTPEEAERQFIIPPNRFEQLPWLKVLLKLLTTSPWLLLHKAQRFTRLARSGKNLKQVRQRKRPRKSYISRPSIRKWYRYTWEFSRHD